MTLFTNFDTDHMPTTITHHSDFIMANGSHNITETMTPDTETSTLVEVVYQGDNFRQSITITWCHGVKVIFTTILYINTKITI